MNKKIHEEEYNIFLKNIQKERDETSKFVKILFAIVVAICLAAVIVLFFAEKDSVIEGIFGSESKITKTFAQYSNAKDNRKEPASINFLPRRQNILLFLRLLQYLPKSV